MKAAWYEQQGSARDVLTVGEMADPQPQAGEVRIRLRALGINPGEVKKRQNAFGYGMPFARIIPHSDVAVLAQGGSIAAYVSDSFAPEIPFWLLVFGNARLYFVGSDDVPADAKQAAARAVNEALEAGWPGLDIARTFPLAEIARAHEYVEHPAKSGRVVVVI